METLLGLLGLGAAAWLWTDSLGARERALRACDAACRQMDVQLLDQTVALAKIRLRRNPSGRLLLARTYSFEFSVNGGQRCGGTALLLGQQVDYVHMDHPEGGLVMERGQRVPDRLQ